MLIPPRGPDDIHVGKRTVVEDFARDPAACGKPRVEGLAAVLGERGKTAQRGGVEDVVEQEVDEAIIVQGIGASWHRATLRGRSVVAICKRCVRREHGDRVSAMLAPMTDSRITWVRGAKNAGPEELIGVLEIKADGSCRALFAERTEIEGRSHIRLAREIWPGKDSLETRWWSLVLDARHDVRTVRNGSCGDSLLSSDVPRIKRALEELELLGEETMIVVDDAPLVLLRRP